MMQHYLLLTPGPLTTSDTVKAAMLKDWCTWDDDYNLDVVQKIRRQLVKLASPGHTPGEATGYSSVLMQGSGTASVESVIGSAVGKEDKLLVINNGAYGARIAEIARYLEIEYRVIDFSETQAPDMALIEDALATDPAITHVAMVHCETTTGMLNPVEAMAELCRKYNKVFILDAMSSFGGMTLDVARLDIGFLISSANKCIQGVPGFGFVIAKTVLLEQCRGQARSLSLDLYAQWHTMETANGKWRFTSPTHVVRAFDQALTELKQEGGIKARANRYRQNQQLLVAGMRELGFEALLSQDLHSPIITSFYSPDSEEYRFAEFYQRLKAKGFVIYPGKVSDADCFRIGNIGEIYPADIKRLLTAVAEAKYW
ncbi:2-aminoethylphosphonate--pyruvate transaminase [Thalassomonas viridans]|uniref:2-aminoethylphosphonate--pyruvate transaminase n=1 Tax=Thalassomonas viridans TaxID=137584 RepID=A0AAF0CDL9_9GAMM|nr:2-aminoethylphosphonate--pyruvate transaminase [Thalassomonas viridans]WDE09313.1 2-aminoethylphosphonate--pyruvate transaminase [Thalassomonas viridans]